MAHGMDRARSSRKRHIMNGENNHVFHTSALEGMVPNPVARRYGWKLFAAQLWLLVAFVAMSLVVVAAKSLITGDEPRAVSAVLGVAGVALFPLAWRNLARMLDAADGDLRSETPPGAKARVVQQLNLALHR
jgi:hypothetical protein